MARDGLTLISGATSGVGEQLARDLSGTCRLVLHGRDAGRVAALRSLLPSGEDCQAWIHDFRGSTEGLEAELEPWAGRIEALVHCVGVASVSAFRLMEPAAVREVFELNFFSALALARALVALDAGHGRLRSIVFISSAASVRGEKAASAYCASKGALDAMVRALAAELAPAVRVNAVLPGLMDTRMSRGTMEHPGFADMLAARYPLGLGDVRDAGAAVRLLLSDSCRWVTGASFVVDGGRTA